jgi:hypothetical protein
MHSQDLDEQFELLSAIPADVVMKWKKAAKQKLRDALIVDQNAVFTNPLNVAFG